LARSEAERTAGERLDESADRPRPARRGLPSLSTFASLRHPNYRLLWIGSLAGNTGDWMDQVVLNWLVWSLTRNPVDLAILNATRALPLLGFALVGGALADRVERRRLLQLTQIAGMALALLLAVLVGAGVVQVWQIFVIGTGRGILRAINQPTRQALISELVPRADLLNAVALNSATMNLTRIGGGALGGLLITLIGAAACFALNAFTFVVMIVALARMTLPPRPSVAHHAPLLRAVGDGIGYIAGRPVLRDLVVTGLAPMVFGMPYMALLPIFADEVLGIGNTGYGLMVALTGVGALAGALTVASLGEVRRRGRLMLAVMGGFGLMLVAFALTSWPPLALALLVGVGAAATGYNAVNNTLLQAHASDEMRGRVMSVFHLDRGLVPLGTLAAGIAAGIVGAPVAVALMGLTVAVLAALVAARSPALRRLD
jgi:MFS family permease